MPLFSVIIPVYNTKKYLNQCINSVLKQKYKNFEIILINDCSTDGSSDVCNSYKNYEEVKVIHNKKNNGAGISRNIGISLATGTYLIFLDSDDYLYQGCFQGLKKLINKNKNKDVIITKFFAEQPPYSNNYLFKKNFSRSKNTNEFIAHINKANYQANVCWHYIIKKNFVIKNKLRFIDAKLNEDQEFVTRLLCFMKSFVLYKGQYYYHRERPGSLYRSIDLKTTKSFLILLSELSNFDNKINWSKEKKKFIQFQIKNVIREFSFRLVLHKNREINQLVSFLNKSKVFFKALETRNLFFLKKKKKNLKDLLTYKQKVISKIKKNFNITKFNNNKIFVYCASVYGIATFYILKENKYNVIGLFDDNELIQSKKIQGICVNKPSILLKKSNNSLSKIIVIVCAQILQTFNDISYKLVKFGINKKQIIYSRFD
jgi:glycosyltransferase involved in cell wall biosynthesis